MFYVFLIKVNSAVFHSEHVLHVLLDTGYVKSVSRRKWLNDFMQKLHVNARNQIREYPSQNTFRFGGNLIKSSIGWLNIPCSINGINTMLQIDVIDLEIPCLISKEAMRNAGVKIDLTTDEVVI